MKISFNDMLKKNVKIESNQIALERLNTLQEQSQPNKFLSYYNEKINWDELVNMIFYAYLESNIGRLIFPTESLLKIFFLQSRYGMSAEHIEKGLHEVESLRKFALDADVIPDATVIKSFSQLLVEKEFTSDIKHRFNI